MKPFQKPIRPEDVREFIDFGLSSEQGKGRYASMATLQSEGVAAIYNILCRLDFAYLADEVGMGKTYQALGVAAVLWNLKPDARVVFLSQRANQSQWLRDYKNFIANNYRKPMAGTGDAVVRCVLTKEPLISGESCNNLRDFASSLAMPGRKTWFLRYTAFRRPLSVSTGSGVDLSDEWQSCCDIMRSHGLWEHESRPPTRTPEKASFEFNKAFGGALNARLSELAGNDDPAIDLLVVDEAQCLRHPENQGNTVLREALCGNVRKWLFLSATPIHTGRHDVRAQVNEYVCDDFISEEDVETGDGLKRKMRSFLVRRPRKFVLDAERGIERVKHQYREHRKEPSRSDEPLGALAMALMQKKLVKLLDGRNNRFRIGFLSSFESLEESYQRSASTTDDVEGNQTDFYMTRDDVPQDEQDRLPPDCRFVTTLGKRFKERFGEDKYLPHPKMDHTVDLLSKAAFDGNQKYLVFCRRIKAVEELRRRLDQRWHHWIARRLLEVWGIDLDWHEAPSFAEPEEVTGDDVESLEGLPDDAGFRNASKKGAWLYNYRLTFRDAGRNARVFQENWLAAICGFTGRDFEQLIDELPEELIQESLAATTREYSGRPRVYPAEFLAYVATALVQREPERLGLSGDDARTWGKFLGTIHPLKQVSSRRSAQTRVAQGGRQLLRGAGFWDVWRDRFSDPKNALHLGVRPEMPLDDLYRREIIKNLIGQSYRLTDVILDMYCADAVSARDPERFIVRFFDYLCGDSPYADLLRRRTGGWIEHFPLILLNFFRTERDRFDLATMAAKGWFPELNDQTAVVGITGGSALNETAIRQFNTPFYPQIIVCTDILKEGVDLHVFCDQVVHYGVAWTSGDLEQRIGRVDRFFSQIERRLCGAIDPDTAKLGIHYPYLADTLEKWQIERVHGRVRDAERILDDFDVGGRGESKELAIDDDTSARSNTETDRATVGHPFADVSRHIPAKGSSVVRQSREESDQLAQQLRDGGHEIARIAGERGFTLLGDPASDAVFFFSAPRNGEQIRYRAEWQFIHDLSMSEQAVYSLRILEEVSPDVVWSEAFSFGYEQQRAEGGGYKCYRTHNAIFRSSPEAKDVGETFTQIAGYLTEASLSIGTDENQLQHIRTVLGEIPNLKKVKWVKPHKAELSFKLQRSQQGARLYVYPNMLLLVSTVAHVDDLAEARFGIGDDRLVRLREWCLDQNRQLSLGFLHLKDGEELNLCERLFIGNLPDTDFQKVITAIVLRADMYEAFLTGQDVY